MRSFASVIGIVAIFAGMVLPHEITFAADKATDKPDRTVFVDLDGDGFDDNAAPPDQNIDANKPTPGAPKAVVDSTVSNGNFFDFDRSLLPQKELFLNNSSAFAAVKQRVVCGLQHRGGFGSGSDFGNGNDVSSGAVIGGVCVGGVCH